MKLFDILCSLTGFNRLRLDACLVRIQNRPPLMLMFNLGLMILNSIFRLKPLYLNLLVRCGLRSWDRSLNTLANQPLPDSKEGFIPVERPSILLVVEDSISQCYRYRVQQKIDQAQRFASNVFAVSWQEGKKARQMMHFSHVVIFYRVPAFADVVYSIKYAKALKRLVFYDVDDLVFDREQLEAKFKNKDEQISRRELQELFKGADLYRQAMALCPFGIASTPTLAKVMEQYVETGHCFVHRNALDDVLVKYAKKRPEKIDRPYTTVFYGSGTKTHDSDLQLASLPIAGLMEKYPTLRMTLVGTVGLPATLENYAERIDRIDMLDIESYLEVLAQADINIAPLEPGLFADAKSEIKWLEAAALGVPSVVSRTRTYDEILTDSYDAMLAATPAEWSKKLELLVTDSDLRKTIGTNAHLKARDSYEPRLMSENLQHIILQAASDNPAVRLLSSHEKQKKTLLFVNVLYPPQEGGGATIVVESVIEHLLKSCSDDYKIVVFTYDKFCPQPYELHSYTHKGVEVTSLSVPVRPDFDWEYRDDTVKEIFRKYLTVQRPDLIHFHSVQRLTASTLEAARELGIPYVVTVHDAWWISDYQFLVDKNDRLCDIQQNDPLVVLRTSGDLNATLRRGRYLREQLHAAQAVLAVSDFQAELYIKNGIKNIMVNKNGIAAKKWLPRSPGRNGKVRLGYLGGVAAHKGYYLLKEAIEQAGLTRSELTLVDYALKGKRQKKTRWGQTDVTSIPPVTMDRMPEFYSNIDVLIAPSIWPESFGLITREAKLAGVWVVASNVGGLAEDVDEGINGNVFEAGRTEELAQILSRIDQKPQKYLRETYTHQKFTVRSVANQVEELNSIYHKILLNNSTEEDDR
jgi:glycosyltransferase involved in cell wall biosynthesis